MSMVTFAKNLENLSVEEFEKVARATYLIHFESKHKDDSRIQAVWAVGCARNLSHICERACTSAKNELTDRRRLRSIENTFKE